MVKFKPLITIGLGVLVLDQLTKWLVVHFFDIGAGWSLIPGYLDLIHVRNRGAAFGLFAGQSTTWTVPFFYLASALSLGLLLLYYLSLKEAEHSARAAISLMCGGALGNLADRVARGTVVDFISVHIQDKWADFLLLGHSVHFRLEWPAFNVADSAITLSVIWLLLVSVSRIPDTMRKVDLP